MAEKRDALLIATEDEKLFSEIAEAVSADQAIERVEPFEVAAKLADGEWGLVVVDAGDGSRPDEVLSGISSSARCPVVVIVDSEEAGIECLERGASDFVRKPLSLRELAARVRARIAERPVRPAVLDYDGLRIDLAARSVEVSGVEVELAPREFDLVAFMATKPNVTFTREELLHEVWGPDAVCQDPETVTEHVYRVRRKIEADPARRRWFITVRRAGYRFQL